jgi:uncharacterized damage-inducible protein DinB
LTGADHCRLMARYNRWMNERMYAAAGRLDDVARKRDRGVFFGSLHRTLNHLLWADRAWIARIEGTGFDVAAYGADLFDDFATLARERAATDETNVALAEDLTDARLAAPLAYRNSRGERRRAPLWVVMTHVFNHQAHHRGQALTALLLAGEDIGATDLIAMPGVVEPLD